MRIERYEVQEISTKNPLTIQLPSMYNQVMGIEIEQFVGKPDNSTANDYLTVMVQGLRGRFNADGTRNEGIITLPYDSSNNRFEYHVENTDDISHEYGGNSINVQVGFVLDYGKTAVPINCTFSQNYLLKLCLLLPRCNHVL